MGDFQPDPTVLNGIIGLLAASLTQGAGHKELLTRLNALQEQPEYPCYLAFIIAHLSELPVESRQLAGLILKNFLKSHLPAGMIPAAVVYVKGRLLSALSDPIYVVRSMVGSCVCTLVGIVQLTGWPELLPTLVHLMDSGNPDGLDGSLNALYKVCEDYPLLLDSKEVGQPLNVLVPKFITLLKHPSEPVKRSALTCLFPFISIMPEAMVANMAAYLEALFSLVQDPSAAVRKHLCRSLVTIFETSPAMLEAHIGGIVDYMMHASTDQDSSVAIEACDFWNALCDTEYAYELLSKEGRLDRLVPILLKGMVYSETDLDLIGADAEDSRPDDAQDLRPKHHKGVNKGGGKGSDGEDEDNDNDDDEDPTAEWNLRKCSASALDLLSGIFDEELLPTLLRHLNGLLASVDWRHRECAILAIGAVAEGCEKGMKAQLPALFPYLLSCLSDIKPLVRSITCWTLSRYSTWVVEVSTGPDTSMHFLRPMVGAILGQMVDRNKRVQEAACSALAVLEEGAQELLTPYLGDIMQTFITCFARYRAHNLQVLYDAIATLADNVGPTIATQELAYVIVPPLLQRWDSLKDFDSSMCPLLECLNSIVAAFAHVFTPFAEFTWKKSIQVLTVTLTAESNGNPSANKDFLMYPLDLLSALCEALRVGVEPLVANCPVMPILVHCFNHAADDVKQSAFALCGDLVRNAYAHISPHMNSVVPAIVANLDTKATPVANNACWCFGELCLRLGPDASPYIEAVLTKIVPQVNSTGTPRNLRENIAITLGRMAIACPAQIGAVVGHFFVGWCTALTAVRDESEKDSAYRGVNQAIMKNPTVAAPSIFYYIDAVLAFKKPANDLEEQFKNILGTFKQAMGDRWAADFPPIWKQNLAERFHI